MGLLAACAAAPEPPSAMERVLTDACAAEIVLLGESGHHGDGEAQAFKAELLQHMLKRCPPDLIAFEASRYEVARLVQYDSVRHQGEGQILRRRVVEPSQLAVALGRKWNRNAEMQPVFDTTAAFMSGGGAVIGLDDQIGAIGQDYSNIQLARDVTQALDPDTRDTCADALRRRIWFDYGDDYPRDAAARTQLAICTDLIELHSRHPQAPGVVRFLRRDALPVERRSADRDASMFDAFHRHYRGGRALIWGATVHTANLSDRLGHYVADASGDVFSLGFSAQSGRFRQMGGHVVHRPDLPQDAVEGLGPGYLDSAALEAAGMRPGAVFGSVQTRNWSRVVDGLVVFETERPTELAP